MIGIRKGISWLIALVMVISTFLLDTPYAFAEEEKEAALSQGSLHILLEYDADMSPKEVYDLGLTVLLLENQEEIGSLNLTQDTLTKLGAYETTVAAQDGKIEMDVNDIPQGEYTVVVSEKEKEIKSEKIQITNGSTAFFEASIPPSEEKEITDNMDKEAENQTEAEDVFVSMFAAMQPVEPKKAVTGTIAATIRFDYPQTMETIEKQNITVALDDKKTAALNSTFEINEDYTIVAKDSEGVAIEVSGSSTICYFDITFSNVSTGEHSLRFEGNGYKSYESTVKLEDYSKHVIVGTSDGTFTIGDANKDNIVDNQDLSYVVQSLGKRNDDCDFNKDGLVNIVDIAYVNHQKGAAGDEEQIETAYIKLDNIKIAEDINVVGNISDILNPSNDTTVTFESANIMIPIEFQEAVEMEKIEITSPDMTGAVEKGKVMVEYENGSIEEFDFNSSTPKGIYGTEKATGTKTITIPLGKRVAVKKIIINVTKVKGQDENAPTEYAVVQEIKFLKDIVPDNPKPANVTVRNIEAVAENESVILSWTELPNVTGYLVRYGTKSGSYDKEMTVTTESATIKGLENFTDYYFVVIPINGSWKGNTSAEIMATPQPNKAPAAPDMLNAESMDGAIKFSWQKAENATYYKVYMRVNQTGEGFKIVDGNSNGGKLTGLSKLIAGLENGTEYELYVIAGNEQGESLPSSKVAAKPQKNEFLLENLPESPLSSDVIEEISMKNSNNIDKSFYPSGTTAKEVIQYVADGDYSTHWTARAWWESSEFIFKFKEPIDMNYLVYIPRLDGKYKDSLDTYSISVNSGDGNFKQVGKGKVRNNPIKTGFAILPFQKSKVSELKVSVAQKSASPTNISLAEILFYEYDEATDINGQVTDLFANDSFTRLKENVTEAEINRLKTILETNGDYLIDKDILLDELKLAEGLLKAEEGALGKVHDKLYSRQGLQPLGVAAKANSEITIYAEIPEGEKVEIVATQYFAEAAEWQKGIMSLENGRNVISVPKIGSINTERGGSLYYKYSGSKGEDIKLHVRRATKIPTLELTNWYDLTEDERREKISSYVSELSSYTWKGDEQTAVLNSTEISMPNVLLSIPASAVKKALDGDAVDKLYNNILAWEEVMHIAKYTHGNAQTMENSDMTASRQNIRYMRMFSGAFMYAAGSHVGIGFGSCGGMIKGVPISGLSGAFEKNKLFGWGIGHEIGHNLDLLGKAEITNNIYAMMIQTYDGKDNVLKSRLESSQKYEQIWDKTALGMPGDANDVFVQLGMYWQLHLAYDDGEGAANGPMDFYHQFFQKWKSNEAKGLSYNDRVAVIASQVAGKDLSEFFTRWGMKLSDSATSQMSSQPKESRYIWYLNDEARRYRLDGGTGFDGSVSAAVEASLLSEQENAVQLKLSCTGDSNALLGYEIRRNGKPIGFTNQATYTDVVGTANNLSYTYQVCAVDKLGNATNLSKEKEIKISYDKTISKNSYTTTIKDGIVTAKMSKVTPVTGIKVGNVTNSGTYKVEVKKSSDSGFVVAKEGSFSAKQDFAAYFNKPGAEPGDTRMWTFDADEIRVTGLPADAEIAFISYPGDNITFGDAVVGRLAKDYRYGDGTEDVIKAGTMIITGNYRGDPLYNIVQVKGRFLSYDVENEESSGTMTERVMDGESILFAEIPKDGEVSDISDGIFIFIPNVQKEKELQNIEEVCGQESILPAFIKAELYRSDDPNSPLNQRLVSDTIWISSPSDGEMPDIVLEGGDNL